MQSQKVTIKEAYYDRSTESICWVVKLASGREADIVFMREEFGTYFKINPDIPESLINEFCERMIGKEISLVVGG